MHSKKMKYSSSSEYEESPAFEMPKETRKLKRCLEEDAVDLPTSVQLKRPSAESQSTVQIPFQVPSVAGTGPTFNFYYFQLPRKDGQ